MTTWTPHRGEMTFEPEYKPEPRTVHNAILNPLPEGTRVRATLGDNILVGETKWPDSTQQYGSLAIVLDGPKAWREDYLSIRLESGWKIELLEHERLDADNG